VINGKYYNVEKYRRIPKYFKGNLSNSHCHKCATLVESFLSIKDKSAVIHT